MIDVSDFMRIARNNESIRILEYFLKSVNFPKASIAMTVMVLQVSTHDRGSKLREMLTRLYSSNEINQEIKNLIKDNIIGKK